MPKIDVRGVLEQALAGEYRLDRELPRGGMSRVFVATELKLGRQVVLKVLEPELVASLSAERFKREIEMAARLQHPHIVPLLTTGAAGPLLYYTMPFVDGESLRDRMSRERPMAIATVQRIIEEVAGALDYADRAGVVHRDIKPENVLFFEGQAVVLDFGIAKALSDSTAVSTTASGAIPRITQAGTSLGTPMYIAPEQAAGDPSIDHRADLYSLGAVAYEMLTGHPPFTGKSPQAVMIAHAREIPEPVQKRRPDVPAPLAKLVMQCLEKDPGRRPQHARDLLKRLNGDESSGGGMGRLLSQVPSWIPWLVAAAATTWALLRK